MIENKIQSCINKTNVIKFNLIETNLEYWWVKNNKRYNIFDNIIQDLLIKNYNKLEDDIMKEHGFFKIWGTSKLN
jgi:hypothetical protein